jgi:hypothetical protein
MGATRDGGRKDWHLTPFPPMFGGKIKVENERNINTKKINIIYC